MMINHFIKIVIFGGKRMINHFWRENDDKPFYQNCHFWREEDDKPLDFRGTPLKSTTIVPYCSPIRVQGFCTMVNGQVTFFTLHSMSIACDGVRTNNIVGCSCGQTVR